jgi:hypothetical protein
MAAATATATAERLGTLVEAISQLNATEYEELFKLLYENKCEYTQNNNGIFLNLSWLEESMISKLELFMQFCKASRREIQHYETLCKNLSQSIPARSGPVEEAGPVEPYKKAAPLPAILPSRNQSSVKFYLLKKKYAKTAVFEAFQNDLEKEAVVL